MAFCRPGLKALSECDESSVAIAFKKSLTRDMLGYSSGRSFARRVGRATFRRLGPGSHHRTVLVRWSSHAGGSRTTDATRTGRGQVRLSRLFPVFAKAWLCRVRDALEGHAQGELDDARVVRLLTQILQPGCVVRIHIIWVIEDVEEIRSETQVHSLAHVEVLKQ